MTSRLATFVAMDGENLAIQEWPLDDGLAMRGVVLLVHGLGEHAGRYDHLAQTLNGWGFAVRGYDHYGHGASGGARGDLPSDGRLLDDLADVVDSTRALSPRGAPLVLLGHSLGGLVAAHFVALNIRPVQALVLSSPALDAGLNRFQSLLLSVLSPVAPRLRLSNGLDVNRLSHDPAVIKAYQADRLVHNRISVRLARFIADAGPATLALAPQWHVPTLLMYAGSDQLVNPLGSRAFAEAAPSRFVSARCFEAMHHEIFNEPDREAVFDTLRQWLDERF